MPPLTLQAGKFFMAFCQMLIFFFKIHIFKKSFRNIIRVPNSFDQIRPQILSGLIWVQPVYKDYQPTALAGEELIVHVIDKHKENRLECKYTVKPA